MSACTSWFESRSPEAGEAGLEAALWDLMYGRAWRNGLSSLAEEAKRRAIPLEAASPELLVCSCMHEWELSPLPRALASGDFRFRLHDSKEPAASLPSAGAWILRTRPGAKPIVEEVMDSIAALSPVGPRPTIVIEESAVVALPFLDAWSGRWPGREAWCRASLLADGSEQAGKRERQEPAVPDRFETLLELLASANRGAGSMRAPRHRSDVFVRAVDLVRAAVAWEEDRAAYWRARESQGFVDGAARMRWMASARRWGLTARDIAPPVGEQGISGTSRHSGGGKVSFLPHTVIAHDPRRAASLLFFPSAQKGRS